MSKDEKLKFKWGFTGRSSPGDECPLMLKLVSNAERIKTFDILSSHELYDKESVDQISSLGFYFALSRYQKPWFICYSCGCGTSPFSKDEEEEFSAINDIYFGVYHHRHCQHIKNLMETNKDWVESLQENNEFDSDTNKRIDEVIQSIRSRKGIKTPLEEDLRTRKYDEKCIMCEEGVMEIEYFPCMDVASCIRCSKKKDSCPLCSCAYSGLIRHYPNNMDFVVSHQKKMNEDALNKINVLDKGNWFKRMMSCFKK